MPKIVKKYGKITLILGLILVLIALYIFTPLAKAGVVTARSDVLSDSRPSPVKSNHTITFTTVTTVPTGGTIILTFDTFAMGTVDFTDIDLKDDTVDLLLAAVPGSGASSALGAAIAGQVLTITENDADTIVGGSVIEIQIGTNATSGVAGDQQITNPVAGVYDIDITGSFGDTGKIKVSVIAGVTVSATVSGSLSFVIGLVTNADCDSSFSVLGGPDSTATTVPFGTLAAVDTFYHACQDLTLSTNATSGYAITTQELTNLRDTTISKNIADTTGDNGLMTESTLDAWATAAAHSGFGYSCVNISGTDCVLAANTNYKQFACTGADAACDPDAGAETPQAVMSKANSVSGSSGRIEYKLSVSGSQQAGTYSNTVMYIATPTY
jgi:hypothetical protein